VSWNDVPARQRSLRATFNYSWNQLLPPEQEVLIALAVFHGRFSRQAVAEVTQAPVRMLQSLVDKSLVIRAADGRYQLHDLLRQYADQKLGQTGALEGQVRDRHSAFYLEQISGWERELKSARQRQVLEDIDWCVGNVKAAWLWAAREGQVERLADALEGLGTYYELRYRYAEGITACQTALDGLVGRAGLAVLNLRGWLLAWQARFCRLLGEVERARELRQGSQVALDQAEALGEDTRLGQALLSYECGYVAGSLGEQAKYTQRSAALYRSLGDAWRQAAVLTWVGELAYRLGEQAMGMQSLQEAVALSRAVGEPRQLAQALQLLATRTLVRGEWETGARLIEGAADNYRAAGDLGQEALALLHLGVSNGWAGRYTEAIELLERALPLLRQMGSRFNVAYGTLALGIVQMHLGEHEQAQRTLQTALEAARQDDYAREIAASLAMLGCVALVQEKPAQAHAAVQESVVRYRMQSAAAELGMALGGLALAELALGCKEAAYAALQEALSIAVETHSHFTSMMCWAASVALLADAGRWEQTLEIYATGQGVPMLANSRWQTQMVAPWIAAATAYLPPEAVEAAQARGLGRDLFDIFAEIVDEF
jgi:tetratricopeptide (TPR) repeat protein